MVFWYFVSRRACSFISVTHTRYTDLIPATNNLPEMTLLREHNVSGEDECHVICFILGQYGCTAVHFNNITMDCKLYLSNYNTTAVMP